METAGAVHPKPRPGSFTGIEHNYQKHKDVPYCTDTVNP